MYTGQPEKYISTVFAFGEKTTFTATAALFIRSLTAPGGATASGTEFAVVIPRNGTLKNLYWSAESSTLTKPGNQIIVNVNGSPTGLMVIWNGGAPFVKSSSNTSNSIPVVAGDKVSIYIQLATGQTGKTIAQPRASIELEVNAQNPNPWDLTGPIVSYQGGNVGIGTASPAGELHVKNAVAGGIAGVFETPSGKILSGRVGASEKFNVDAAGNLYASGKVGIGNPAPATELDVNGTVQMQGIRLPTGAGNSLVLTSDGSGNGTWQPTGGAGGTIDGSGTVNAIPMFLGATTLDDSVIFENGGSIGIGTATPMESLEVAGNARVSMLNFRRDEGVEWRDAWIGALTSQPFSPGIPILHIGGITGDDGFRRIGLWGDTTTYGPFHNASSRRWKTNIQPIQAALDIVLKLSGVSFEWKETGKSDIGFIAEDVGKVIPEIVTYEENGEDAQGLEYIHITAVLVEAIKEQQNQLEELKMMVKSLLTEKGMAPV